MRSREREREREERERERNKVAQQAAQSEKDEIIKTFFLGTGVYTLGIYHFQNTAHALWEPIWRALSRWIRRSIAVLAQD